MNLKVTSVGSSLTAQMCMLNLHWWHDDSSDINCIHVVKGQFVERTCFTINVVKICQDLKNLIFQP
jgi:hypothetical protein